MRTLRVRPAEDVPDVATVALDRARVTRRWPYQSARVSLAVLAAIELVFAFSGVVAGRDSSPIHDTQHLGAFGAAIAAAVIFVAWRPRLARGLLPVAITLGCAIPVFALVDLANDNLSAGGVLHHLVQMLALALVWIVSAGTRVRVPQPSATKGETEQHGHASPVTASSISSTR